MFSGLNLTQRPITRKIRASHRYLFLAHSSVVRAANLQEIMSKNHSTASHFFNTSSHDCRQMPINGYQHELLKDIDFDSSFSDSPASESMDDSDLFDPADLEGLVMPSSTKRTNVSISTITHNPNKFATSSVSIEKNVHPGVRLPIDFRSTEVPKSNLPPLSRRSSPTKLKNIPSLPLTINSSNKKPQNSLQPSPYSSQNVPLERNEFLQKARRTPIITTSSSPTKTQFEDVRILPHRSQSGPNASPNRRNVSQNSSNTSPNRRSTSQNSPITSSSRKNASQGSPKASPIRRDTSQSSPNVSPRIAKIHEYLSNTQFTNESPSKSTKTIFDKNTSTFKRPKSEPVAQIRNLSTSAKRLKHEDFYPTIQLATQRPLPANEKGPTNKSIASTKDLKSVKPIILSSEQEYVLQMAIRGNSIFFTGSAGTGKSVLLRSIIKSLKSKYNFDQVAVTASTGLAACNIGGVTLHSFAGIGLGQGSVEELIKKVKRNKKALKKWVTTKVLVIDEISMIDGRLLDKLNGIAKKLRYSTKPFGGIQIIACGDFYQLPPVSKTITLEDGQEVEDEALFAFESSAWSNAIRSSIILKEVFRQKGDQVFIDMLNSMRTGIVSSSTETEFRRLSRPLDCPAGIVPTQLYATRTEVDDANKLKLSQIPGASLCYNSIDGGSLPPNIRQIYLNNFLAPQRLFLKKGAQVMCIKNFDDTLVNGSLGQVIDFLDRDTYMCQGFFEEYPHLSVDEIKEKLQDKKNEGDHNLEDVSTSRLDSVFAFLNKFEEKAAVDYTSQNEQSQEEAFLQNSQRKRELLEKLQEVSGGEKFPLVRFLLPDGVNTRDVLVEPEQWTIEDEKVKKILASRTQLPLMLAWALSIHKAQGQTLAKAKVDLSRVFENGQAYVALSRAVSRDGLQVLNFRKEKVTTHVKVQEFYKSLMSTEDLASISYKDESRPLLQKDSEKQASKVHA